MTLGGHGLKKSPCLQDSLKSLQAKAFKIGSDIHF